MDERGGPLKQSGSESTARSPGIPTPEQTQELDAVARLAGGIAHVYNNLLTTILGYSDLLLRDLPAEDPSRGGLEAIRRAGAQAADLTRQLLAFGCRQILNARVIDLNTLINGMQPPFRALLPENIELTLALDPALGLVSADRGQLEQMLIHLITNARDGMPQGGKLVLTTTNVTLDEKSSPALPEMRPGPHVLLTVADTSDGMNEETKKRLFEPFFSSSEAGSTGLGLAAVYGMVKQNGGLIHVHSEPGQGTTFRIYMPRVEGKLPAVAAPGLPATTPPTSDVVLLAEDEESVRRLVRTILQMSGYSVLEADCGADALLLSENHSGPIHLLLTDLTMPNMTGRELADNLMQQRPGLKVLYLSGYSEDAVAREEVAEGRIPFLQKPFTPDQLLRKVAEVLGR